jgi:endo-1,4-beta-xylanase
MKLITLVPIISVSILPTLARLPGDAPPPSLDAKFRAHGKKYFGTCTDMQKLTTGSNAAIIAADFGQVTPENSMKWQSTEPNKDRFQWPRQTI